MTGSVTNTNATAKGNYVMTVTIADLHDLGAIASEHRAYGECIQFEGDTCGECERLAADFDALSAALEAIREYNTAYAQYVNGRAALYAKHGGTHKVGEADLVNAHVWAGRGDLSDIPPIEGWGFAAKRLRVDQHGEPVCQRCWGAGMADTHPHINGGACFECGRVKRPEGLVTRWADEGCTSLDANGDTCGACRGCAGEDYGK